MILNDTDPEVQKAFQTILSVFGGEDGGGSFARLAGMIVDFDRQAKTGDPASKQILGVVKQFGRLCELNLDKPKKKI